MNEEWEKFGKDICNIVEDAVNSQDFGQLNKMITNTVNEAVNSVQKGLKTAGQAVNEAASKQKSFQWKSFSLDQEAKKYVKEEQKKEWKTKRKETGLDLFKKNTPAKIGGLVLTICGYTFSTGIGLAIIILFLVTLFLNHFNIGIKIALSILLPLFVGTSVMAWKGSSILSSLKRYHQYVKELQGRTYCNIKELADKTGKSFSFVLKDVRKMIKKGWFKQGHLDQDNACLIVSHDTYQEYQEIQRQRIEQKEFENGRKNREEKNAVQDNEENPEVQKVMTEGKLYITRIQESNRAIADQEISKKISHMETLIQKIFERVKENPDSLSDIQKMMEYYLPTTVKLLGAYQRLDSQPIQGENIRSSKIEIEKTLDTLNLAFEKLLDSLFEEVAWDVSSDISVLHTMLAQEGLTGDDFSRQK